MTESLTTRYGAQSADALRREVRQEYSKLIVEIPHIRGGMRTRVLNSFLIITAQDRAVYKVMIRHGKSAAEAWELCHEALRRASFLAFSPFICMSDIALSEALGWGLARTQTLADGCEYCDFRFRKGAATMISSKTAEVQKAIERIRENEAEQALAADADQPRR